MAGEKDAVEDLTGGVAVVTGASSGIGLAAAKALARRGWTVALVGRDADRLASAHAEVRREAGSAKAFRCNFAVLDEVRELAAALCAEYPRIDVLACNAGGAFSQRKTTVDGHELTIQVNHLAHFLLAHLLRERLAGGRLINTASRMWLRGALDPDDLDGERRRGHQGLAVYSNAKQANVLFAAELARRWPEVLATSYHPGVVRTRFGNDNALFAFFYRYAPLLRSPARGADTLVWLATTEVAGITPGGYYVDRRLNGPGGRRADPALAARLWEASLAAVEL